MQNKHDVYLDERNLENLFPYTNVEKQLRLTKNRNNQLAEVSESRKRSRIFTMMKINLRQVHCSYVFGGGRGKYIKTVILIYTVFCK